MEPVTLILTALAAGTSAGALDALKDDAKEKVKAAYRKLHAPQKWEGLLTAELTEAGAAQDDDLVAAAKTLLELVDQSGAKSGKYNVTIKDSHGVQVGDGNFQVNKF
jgi:hypothetical protein